MLVLIALLIALIPSVAILYPFLRETGQSVLEDESSPLADLQRRWESTVAGLRSAELDRAIGTLAEDDYEWLKQQYMTEAAQIMKAMELEEHEEEAIRVALGRQIGEVRRRAGMIGEAEVSQTCPGCFALVRMTEPACPSCGNPMNTPDSEASSPKPGRGHETAGE